VITGTPVAHDTELEDLIRGDPSWWALLLASLAVMAVAFASAIALGHIIAAKRAHAR
jgi:hypothetical protein